ncbi:MAG: GGDEF domain-containing protein [Pirellulaceae bacterium]
MFRSHATPIFDSSDSLAGTLISFEDVTVLEQQNKSLLQTLAELENSRKQIQAQNVKLQELASMDALTGVFNRRSLFEQLEQRWISSKKNNSLVNCIMLDVDHFKKLNDNHGHAVGDQVLRDVSRTISENGWPGKVPLVGMVAKSFVCCCRTDAEQAAAIGETIRKSIADQLAQPYSVTASFGVSSSVFGAATYQGMLEQADLSAVRSQTQWPKRSSSVEPRIRRDRACIACGDSRSRAAHFVSRRRITACCLGLSRRGHRPA